MNTSKTILASTAVVLALALVLAPLVLSDALATKNKKSNFAEQIISQVQKSNQKSQVVSGGDSIGSGNNINIQGQFNSGNNALAQSND